jgi:hypothetical protein
VTRARPACQLSIVALPATATLVLIAVRVAQALDAEADARIADGIVGVADQLEGTRRRAFTEREAAPLICVVTMTIAQALDAAP